MPVKSYIIFSKENKKEKLISELNLLQKCEAIPSESHDIILLVTDAPEDEEKVLLAKINELKSLQHISFVSGFSD